MAANLIWSLLVEWFKRLSRKVSKPYYLRYKYDDDKGFYLDENRCPLCSKCLFNEKSTPGKYLGNRKMLCPVHGEVDGAKSVKDSKTININVAEETADEVLIKRKWINPKGEGIMPISAESTEVIKTSSGGGAREPCARPRTKGI